MAKVSHEQLVEEFRGKILPPNHPLTHAVRNVVTRILEASNLGSLKSESAFVQQAGTPSEESWPADAQNMEGPVPGSGGNEWRLMVVSDPKVVNAMASFGQRLTTFTRRKTPSELTEQSHRQYRCLYWDHSCCTRRRWPCRYPRTRSVFQVQGGSVQR